MDDFKRYNDIRWKLGTLFKNIFKFWYLHVICKNRTLKDTVFYQLRFFIFIDLIQSQFYANADNCQ